MLIFIRHGRTEANARGLLLGHADPGLDDHGMEQAARLSELVGPVDIVVSSPLRRARETAAYVGIDVEIDDRFIELDYGEYDGRPVGEVPAQVWAEWKRDISFRPPGGETLAELGVRVRAGCEDWAVAGAERDVAIVSHVSPIKAATAWALGVTDEVGWRTFVSPASVTRVGVVGGAPVLRSFNEVVRI